MLRLMIMTTFLAMAGVLVGCGPDGSFRAAVDALDTKVPDAEAGETDADADAEADAAKAEDGETDGADAPGQDETAEGKPDAEAIAPDEDSPAEAPQVADAETAPEQKPLTRRPDPNADVRAKCERQGGNFAKTPSGNFVCVTLTNEGNKFCTAESQCKGGCLARSQTCSPVTPLIGCHQMITGSGGMATVCLD